MIRTQDEVWKRFTTVCSLAGAEKIYSLKNKRQMRWHPLVVRFALSLFYSSRVAYRTSTSSDFLALPSERTLRDYTHWCSAHSGVQFEYIEQAKKVMSQEGVSEDERQFTLLFDEMKVKGGLVFRKSTGRLVGFCDLGQANRDIDCLFHPLVKAVLVIKPLNWPKTC